MCLLIASAPQILSMKNECTFLFLNILIIGLCNTSANSFSKICSSLTVQPEAFLSKNYRPLKQVYVDVHHVSGF